MVDNNKSITTYLIDNKALYFIFMLFIISSIFINMCNGTFSVVLNNIQIDLNITSDSKLGLVSSVFFIGQVCGCFICLFIIEFNIRKLIFLVYLLLCIVSLGIIGFYQDYYTFLICRFINGFGASYIALFNPVWIDQFSSSKVSSIFMAMHNLSSIIGTILGFVMGSIMTQYNYKWYTPFSIQSAVLLLNFIIILFSEVKYFDRRMVRTNDNEFTLNEEESIDESQKSPKRKSSKLSVFSENKDGDKKRVSIELFIDKNTNISFKTIFSSLLQNKVSFKYYNIIILL